MSFMRDLMNAFHERERTCIEAEQWEKSFAFGDAESHANNCHQMTAEQIVAHLAPIFENLRDAADSAAEREGWTEALALLHEQYKHRQHA